MDRRLTRVLPGGRSDAAIWIAALAGATMAVGVVAVWWNINDRAREHIRSAALDATRINQSLIRQDIDNRLSALDRLAQRWTASGGTSPAKGLMLFTKPSPATDWTLNGTPVTATS